MALLHDARIFISGGYNGVSVFDDLWVLDLSSSAYLPQVVSPTRDTIVPAEKYRLPLKLAKPPINQVVRYRMRRKHSDW